jgi:addiction module RelE/StbE family toxin
VKKKFEVIWAGIAERDLSRIIEYIANENPANASKILEKLRRRTANLHYSPRRGRIVPELREYGIHQYRELIIAPWRVLYRIQEDRVHVLAVLDSRRNIEDILLERVLDAKF